MTIVADRPDLEMIAMLHVARTWLVETPGTAYPASTLALALRLAEVRRGNRVEGITSADGRYRLSPQQIERLQQRSATHSGLRE